MSSGKQKQRGPHPEDKKLFDNEKQIKNIRTALYELSWLLSRGYAVNSSLKIVGDHNRLIDRQRKAISRAACSENSFEIRKNKCLEPDKIKGQHLIVDGFNLIITLETALSGGGILLCPDGCYRDISGIHGSYKKVSKTDKAVMLVGEYLELLGPESVTFLFDKPVSNSIKISIEIEDIASEHNWPFKARAVYNPDRDIIESGEIAVSSDSVVIENAKNWFNLTAYILNDFKQDLFLVDLGNSFFI